METRAHNMDSAFSRFFNIMELTEELASQLDLYNISCLMQTSRTFCRVFEPFLYRGLTLHKEWMNPLVSAFTFQALARNTHHVLHWNTRVYDTAYVYNGLIAHQEQSEHLASSSASGQPGSRPSWLPPPDDLYTDVTPFPAMSNLSKLHMKLVPSASICERPYPRMSTFQVQRSLFHACWIAQSCPVLVELVLDPVIISTLQDFQVLAGSLNRMTRLLYLRLSILLHEDLAWQCFSTIFFACPSSLQKLRMPVKFNPRIDHDDHTEGDVNQDGLLEVPPEQRDVPLAKLRTFSAGKFTRDTPVDEISAIFAHCPNIDHLCLPDVTDRGDVDKIAKIIVDACPRLSILYVDDDDDNDSAGDVTLLSRILELMPAQQASKIKFSDTIKPLKPKTISRLFQRHSNTLHSLDLSRCRTIRSKVLQLIFQECLVLEELRTHPSGFSGPRHITLEDAVSGDWVCSRLRCFGIEIGVELSPTFSHEEMAYFRRPPPIVLSAEETRLFALLEELYRRLGALTELEELDLRARDLGPDSSLAFMDHSFPGMFSLGDPATGRPGYLDLLKGWKKLRILEGSILAPAGEGDVTMGAEEAAWMGEHWLALRMATFFFEDVQIPEEFKLLQKQRRDQGRKLSLSWCDD